MARFAFFNHTDPSPQRVRGWYDTLLFHYPKLPAEADLFPLSDAQWDAHMPDPSGWVVNNGALERRKPPAPPSMEELHAAELAKGKT